MTHTPEPWVFASGEYDSWSQAHERQPTHPTVFTNEHGSGTLLGSPDYARALACVNALAGIPDPAAELARLREVERAAGSLLDALEPVRVDGRNTYEIGAAMKAKASLRAALDAAKGGAA